MVQARELRAALKLLAPYRMLARPKVLGIERIPPARPLLFVGNHTVLGIFDPPLLFAELYDKKGIVLRSLGDHVHFKIPLWRDFLARFGTVDGTRENCARLLAAGESVLVFPGGAREVAKRKGERYRLIWKDRLGFIKMALAHEATLVPFASVGVEDALEIVADAEDLLRSPLAPLFRRMRRDAILPIVRPVLGNHRIYFSFAPPIATQGLREQANDDDACRSLRARVQKAVEDEIARCVALQQKS